MGVGRLWTGSTACATASAAVAQRLDRLQSGNPGECRSLGGGLIELRVEGQISRGRGDWLDRGGKSAKAMKQRTRSSAVSYQRWLGARLAADPDLSVEYLRQVLEQSETPEELLIGRRRVAEVLGMSRVAAVAGLSRESLYRSLSAPGNPRLSTLVAVLRVAGLRLSVRPAA